MTRKELEVEGQLVSLEREPYREEARRAGYRLPVAIERCVWDRYVVPDVAASEAGHDELLRLGDVLWMGNLMGAARNPCGRVVRFKLRVAGYGIVSLVLSIRRLDDGPYLLVSSAEPDSDEGLETMFAHVLTPYVIL